MKTLLVFGQKTFRITITDNAKVTFGPWSPPTGAEKYGQTDKALNGTLRIYESAKSGASILAVFSGVTGYRDLSLEYAEEVAREEGATIWKSDQNGYVREEKVSRSKKWSDPLIEGPKEEDDF